MTPDVLVRNGYPVHANSMQLAATDVSGSLKLSSQGACNDSLWILRQRFFREKTSPIDFKTCVGIFRTRDRALQGTQGQAGTRVYNAELGLSRMFLDTASAHFLEHFDFIP